MFLFTTSLPFPETEIECERVIVERNPLKLLAAAQRVLWPLRVALAVTTWDTEPGDWMAKVAAFFIPWFRVLVKNENDDFFPATPPLVLRHALTRLPAQFIRLRDWPRRTARIMPARPILARSPFRWSLLTPPRPPVLPSHACVSAT